MAHASHEMANGSLDQRISYSGEDEIGTLSENFNSMAEKLSGLIDSLKKKEISLEKAYNELVQTQEQLVQSEKMAAIGELVASIVHEMRSPLSSVKLNYQIIGRTLDRNTPISEHYSIGMNQVSQLERMFSDLLDYSRPITLEKVPFNIPKLIEESLAQLKPHMDGHVVISSDIDESLPLVLGDQDKIRQVMVNIIKNALEAAGPKGRIEISAGMEDSAGKPVITVTDYGSGISSQDIERIFQPFFTTRKKGTGLGLAIVKKIMDAHRFGISVSSEEGRGTTVSLHFHLG